MIPWEHLDAVPVPGGRATLSLHRRDDEYSIRLDGQELMNSRMHGSEEALAELACSRLAGRRSPRVLIGGLGMGFTLAAALRALPRRGAAVVAELVPGVIDWNRTWLGDLAGRPLDDPRVEIVPADVIDLLRRSAATFDAVLLDVDNGPDGLTRTGNDWLYGGPGLTAVHRALRGAGVVGVWSPAPDGAFVARLEAAGFAVEKRVVPARASGRGGRHVVWIGTRRAE